jgi:hypothetical protein
MHCSICEGVINSARLFCTYEAMDCHVGPRGEVGSTGADCLPSILPCSQSTMIQSAPDLARTLETLAPGSICQNPIAGRLASVKTCFSQLDFNILEPVAMADIERHCGPAWLV